MKSLLYILIGFCLTSAYAQEKGKADSLWSKKLDEVVVTATRSERQMGALPMPVTLVSQKQIKQMGSLRLNDVLAEQTGLFITNDHGNGVQIQGFNPDYTLILVDGEPLVGRTAGTLELSRLAVGNIKQIEIVKGPSSSLYGSEALAGVINIITNPLTPDEGTNAKGDFSVRYGTNQTADVSANASFRRNKVGLTLFANRYSSGGYDLSPEIFGKTVSPFVNYTFSPKLTYNISERTKLSISSRYFSENQDNGFLAGQAVVTGTGEVKDWNLNPSLTHKFSNKLKTTLRFYTMQYRTNAVLKYETDGKIYDENFFSQLFQRPEIQVDYIFNQRNILTAGVGYIAESVEATRYDETKRFNTKYAFVQHEYFPNSRLHFIFGGRFDAHSAYQSQFSPKVSTSYELSKWLTLRGSAGVGFKAPDFRQLYLNFTNAVAGYSVFGANEVARLVSEFQKIGQISDILIDPSTFGNIRPESSTAYNLGFKASLSNEVNVSVNAFRNDIKDLIETAVVARKTNGQNVFSYRNLSNVFTQGIEIDAQKRVSLHEARLTISAGYQYLEAKDKAVLDEIKAGNVYRRDPVTLITQRLKTSDYGGLFNRSRHSANLKLFWENNKKGLSASLRGIYRSHYGLGDLNGNAILDADNEYVKGYVTLNASVAKEFGGLLRVQAGVDNLLNYTDRQNIPGLAGRLVWLSMACNFKK